MSQSVKVKWIQDKDPSQLDGFYVWVKNPTEEVVVGVTPHDYRVTPLQKTGTVYTPREIDFNLRQAPDGSTTVVVAEKDAYGRWKWIMRDNRSYINQGGDISKLPLNSLNPNGPSNVNVNHDGSTSTTIIDCKTDGMGNEFLVATYVDTSTGAVSDTRTLYGFTGDFQNPINDPHAYLGHGWPYVKCLGTPTTRTDVTASITVAPDSTLRINGYPAYQFSSDTSWIPTGIEAPAWHAFDCAGNPHNNTYVAFNPDDIDGDGVLNDCDAHHPDNIGYPDSDRDGILDKCDSVFNPQVVPQDVADVSADHSPNPLVGGSGAYRNINGQQVQLPEVLTFTNLGSSTTGASQHLDGMVLTLDSAGNTWRTASTYAHQTSSSSSTSQYEITIAVNYTTSTSLWSFILSYPKYQDSTWNRKATQASIKFNNISDLWNTTDWSNQPSSSGRDLEISIAESYTSTGANPLVLTSPAAPNQPTANAVPSGFNISIRDTESNILASTPTNPSGQVTIAFATDTYELYVWDGSDWSIYNND